MKNVSYKEMQEVAADAAMAAYGNISGNSDEERAYQVMVRIANTLEELGGVEDAATFFEGANIMHQKMLSGEFDGTN